MSRAKVIGYYPLHYGKEYLKESIASVIDLVDELYFLYTPRPSYGYGTDAVNPDTEQELKDIALVYNKSKWVSKTYSHEGAHRGAIMQYAQGYDLILAIDADEVFNTEELDKALALAHKQGFKNYGIDGYVNFFRSFNWVCYDGFRPIRVIKPSGSGQGELKATVYHFGTAQSRAIMIYKYLIHGHKDEIRPDWLDKIYYGTTLKDLHPVALGLWNAVSFNKHKLPEALRRHPNFNKGRI